MSFGITTAGAADEVAEHVRSVKSYPDQSPQLDRIKELLTAELQDVAPGRGVIVEANGHADGSNRNFTINFRTFWKPEKTEETGVQV